MTPAFSFSPVILRTNAIAIVTLLFFSGTVRSSGINSIKLMSSDDTDSDICPRSTTEVRSCPVNCFRPDPVCGVDGVTYWCGCADANCSGTRVVKLGFCQVGNGGNGPISGQALLLVHIVWLIVIGFAVILDLL